MRIIIGNNTLRIFLVTPSPALNTQINEFFAYRKINNLPWSEKPLAFVVGRITILGKLILFGKVNANEGPVVFFWCLARSSRYQSDPATLWAV